MPNPIVHFEIPADDVARAKSFYGSIFGWKIEDWKDPTGAMEYSMVYTRDAKSGMGIDGGLMKRKDPAQPFMNYIHVDSIDATNARITAAGGTVRLPKTEIAPGMGWISAFQDPEGNLMGLHEMPHAPVKRAGKKKAAKKKSKRK